MSEGFPFCLTTLVIISFYVFWILFISWITFLVWDTYLEDTGSVHYFPFKEIIILMSGAENHETILNLKYSFS